MKVMLVMPPNWGVEMPPLGVSYIAAAIENDKHEVTILDYNIKIWHELKESMPIAWAMDSFDQWTDEDLYEKHLADKIDPLFQKLLADIIRVNPHVIGFSHFMTSVHPVERMCKKIRKLFPQIKIILGGPQVRDEYAEKIVRLGYADAAVIGEGEATTREVLKYWENKEKIPRPIAGAILRGYESGTIIKGKDRPAVEMNDLSFPDFSRYDLRQYMIRSLPFSMSRGCVKRCTFCAEAPFWKRYRVRSARSIFLELKEAKEKYGIDNFLSHDSLMNGNFEVLDELINMIIAEDLRINWHGMCRLDKRMDLEVLKRMRRAGCTLISYGLESGSQKIADMMKKGVQIDDALQVIRDTHKAGIVANVFIIVGFPKENWIDFVKTMLFLYKIRKEIFLANVSDAGLMEGTPMDLRKKQFGIIENSKLGGGWHDRFYLNTIYHRKFKLWLMRKFIKFIRISENKTTLPMETMFEYQA